MALELPDTEPWGGKMGGNAHTASGGRDHRLVPLYWLLAFHLATSDAPAFAQDQASSCAPALARVVSLQGTVDVQRAGIETWTAVRRLDTSICAGDRLRTAALSRAALFVQPETLVRVDENTTIMIHQTTDEIFVEFSTDQLTQIARNEQSCGAGYFITRFPKKFRVATPHVNAAVEGTEFMVESSCEASRVTVLEGKVLSQVTGTQESRSLTAGQKLETGPATPTAFSTVIKPEDAVQWVLRYPPLSDAGMGGGGAGVARAEEMLRVGQVDESLREIEGALRSNPSDSTALALRAVVQIAKNEKTDALESSRTATTANPGDYRGWLALSYAEQATFELERALESAKKAQALKGDSSLIHARVAELQLSLANSAGAEESATAALRASPDESSAHAILGFVQLAKIHLESARDSFLQAIELDSFNPLPRLGLGLALIRSGDLVAGREQLEVAVALDPANALFRSYAGKAYYEENTKEREELALSQLSLSKQMDPRDPTPWFYEAILRDSQNQPVDALIELQESIARNDNRAVYRSRFLLDDDAAARSASVAAAYDVLGFERLSIGESAKALTEDAGNFSAHRQLARAYADLPRHDIARVSEALQAQIRQPVSLASMGPALGTDILVINRDTGPARPGTNEFNALFNRNDVRLQIDGVVGGLDTFGDQFVASALHDNFSYTLGQLHHETDGFSENDFSEKDIYNLLIHGQMSPSSAIQLDVKRSKFAAGQRLFQFDEFPLPTTIDLESDTYRLSGYHALESGRNWIWTAIFGERERASRSFPDGGLFFSSESEPLAVETQYMGQVGPLHLIAGVGYLEETERFSFEEAEIRNEGSSAYVYAQWKPLEQLLSLHLGVAAEQFESTLTSIFAPEGDTLERSELSPKLGLVWSPKSGTTVRAAAFAALHRPFVHSQTIEPTQMAGFNQFFTAFDEIYGEFLGIYSERVGLAVDQVIGETAFAGVEYTWRRMEVPSFVFGRDFTWREQSGHAYVYKTYPAAATGPWLGEWQASLSAELEYESVERPQVLTGAEGIMELETITVPFGVQFFGSKGTAVRLATSYVSQDGVFSIDVGFPIIESENDAWITDLSVEQRLPRRKGVVAVGVRNLFDNRIELVEVDPVNPRIATQRYVFAGFSLEF